MHEMNSAYQELKWNMIGWLGKVFIDIISRTMRITSVGFDPVSHLVSSKKFILALWHSRLLIISYLYKGWNAAILVSASRDGEIIARILQKQGHETIRGSSSRHGIKGLTRLIHVLNREVRPGGMIPDGPRGPRFRAQPGVITIAKKTGYPIIPVSYSARRIKVFNSWDRFILPYPFTIGRVIYGKPIFVPKDVDSKGFERFRKALEDELNRITRIADQYFGHTLT
nr:DUF374 domain-containing protein [Desulfobacterales bacterium]